MPEQTPLQTLFDTLPHTGRLQRHARACGGITTRVVEGGEVGLGDEVQACLGIRQTGK